MDSPLAPQLKRELPTIIHNNFNQFNKRYDKSDSCAENYLGINLLRKNGL